MDKLERIKEVVYNRQKNKPVTTKELKAFLFVFDNTLYFTFDYTINPDDLQSFIKDVTGLKRGDNWFKMLKNHGRIRYDSGIKKYRINKKRMHFVDAVEKARHDKQLWRYKKIQIENEFLRSLKFSYVEDPYDHKGRIKWPDESTKKKYKNKRNGSARRFVHAWRKAVLSRDDNRCVVCGSLVRVEAHHIYNYKNYPEYRSDVDNGVALCHEHHKEFHSMYGVKNNTQWQWNEFYGLYGW